MHNLELEAFQGWLQRHFSASETTAIPLFSHKNMVVKVDDKRVPLRSQRMEEFYRRVISKVRDDAEFCGIIYCMYWIRSGRIVPLYFGKAERYGNTGQPSSNLTVNPGVFGRWGYSPYYHLGNLGVGLNGGSKSRNWIETLFQYPSDLRLHSETFFGAVARTHKGLCPCGDRSNVAALEECLIRHARRFWPDDNLNQKRGGSACRCPS
jgi:hypothetical protein